MDETVKILNTELRFISQSHMHKLSVIIDKAQSWKLLLSEITRARSSEINPKVSFKPLKISSDSVTLIEQQTFCGLSPSSALLNYWSISGRIRPTIRNLIEGLLCSNLHRAVEYVCISILEVPSFAELNNRFTHYNLKKQVETIQSPCTSSGLSAIDVVSNKFDTNLIIFPSLIEEKDECNKAKTQDSLNTTYIIDPAYAFEEEIDLESYGFVKFCFNTIYKSTNGFCHKPYRRGTDIKGTKLGEGRFSSVFVAKSFRRNSNTSLETHVPVVLAAKLLKSDCEKKHILSELSLNHKLKHPNLLELLGVASNCQVQSTSGKCLQYICLLYDFMANGSLLECLDSGLRTQGNIQLTANQRAFICSEISKAVCYLHSIPIVHRDIKSANILIDEKVSQPKLGDFSLVRRLEANNVSKKKQEPINTSTNTGYMTQNVIGTTVYMPPEAFRGDISSKFDTFSFGIVTIELITGMKPFDETKNEDLYTFIYDRLSDIDDEVSSSYTSEEASLKSSSLKYQFLDEIIDVRTEWKVELARKMFDISLQCCEPKKKLRPLLSELQDDLKNLTLDAE